MPRSILAILWLSACVHAQPVPADVNLTAISADERERDSREKVAEVIRALRIQPGSVVADIGTGYGYYAVRLSPAVGPRGRVFAEEIDGPLVEKLRGRLAEEKIGNVTVLLGAPDDPRLPKVALDAVLLSDVYHEIERPAAVLARLKEALKPGGRLIIVDYLEPSMAGRPRAEQGKKHNIGPEYVERDLKMAGFTIVERRESLARGYGDIPLFYVLASLRSQ